jgi:electron transport complex protein RnfC
MEALKTFKKGGIHPPENKEYTENLPIEEMPLPSEVDILLLQHFGATCKPLVKKKDKVQEADIIGDVEKGLGACVHASVTGTVKAIGESAHPLMVSVPSITIERDPEAEQKQYTSEDWHNLSREELLNRVKKAGIVGMGGAGFPTHVKLSPPPDAKVDTLIINGAECEPYLTVDHRLMVEHSVEIVEGIKIILTILGINKGYIGIEANKPDAIEEMNKAVKENSDGFDISVVPLKVKYPQGSEKQLIEAVTGRKVPAFGLPFDVGVIVQNIGTTKAIYESVVFNKPVVDKVVTFSGKGISRPANLKVRIGTRVRDVVEYLGGTKPELKKVVVGGPMMGFVISTLDFPITKTTSGVLFLTEEEIDLYEHKPCIRCGFCLEACPMGLQPNEIGIYVEAGRAEETSQFGVFECFECGCCAYVCPSKRPLVQFIRIAKMKAKR